MYVQKLLLYLSPVTTRASHHIQTPRSTTQTAPPHEPFVTPSPKPLSNGSSLFRYTHACTCVCACSYNIHVDVLLCVEWRRTTPTHCSACLIAVRFIAVRPPPPPPSTDRPRLCRARLPRHHRRCHDRRHVTHAHLTNRRRRRQCRRRSHHPRPHRLSRAFTC